jgi:hypothetical protein
MMMRDRNMRLMQRSHFGFIGIVQGRFTNRPDAVVQSRQPPGD